MERGESSSIAIVPLGGNQEEDDNRRENQQEDDNIVNRLSSGYRFHPTDEEIAIVPFGGNQEEDDNIVNRLASGYRFHPTDEEIMADHLIKKIPNRPLPPNKIVEVDLSKYNPEDVADSSAMISIDAHVVSESIPIEDVHVVNESIPIEDPSHAVNQSGDSSDNNVFGDSSRCPCGALLGCCLCNPSLVLDYWVDSITSEISLESPPPNDHTHEPE